MAQTTQVRQIRISVDTKGNRDLQTIANQMSGLNRNVKSLASSMGFLRSAFVGYFSSLGVREIVDMSDTMQRLNDRIAVLAGGTDEAKIAMEGLLERANRTKTSIDGLADIYARLSASTKETGLSTRALLDLTEVLQNSFRIAGAGIQEANSAAIQLSQGFASGQLRGQELRSVLEANVVIGDILAKTFNVTRGELYKMAEAGNLTAAKVMKALFDNMGAVNSQAAKLGQTFEQSLTVALNNLKVQLLAINQQFDLSGKFARGLDALAEKFTLLITLVGVLALTRLPLLITQVERLTKVLYAFAASNPITAAFTIAGIVILSTFKNLKEFTDYLKFAYASLLDFGASVADVFVKARKAVTFEWTNAQFKKETDAIAGFADTLRAKSAEIQNGLFQADPEVERRTLENIQAQKERAATMEKLAKLAEAQGGKERKLKEILGDLNQEYRKGNIDATTYFARLQDFERLKLERNFRDGKIELDKFNKGLREIEENDLRRALNSNVLTLQEFNRAIEQNKVEELNDQFAQGALTMQQYDYQLSNIQDKFAPGSAFMQGTQDFLDSIGTIGSNIADGVKKTFQSLEDSLVEFIKTGKFNFAQFTQAILDDLTRIIIRASIIRPLAQGILGGATAGAGANSAGGSYTDVSAIAAKGMAFEKGGIKKFASGGIVNRPTLFSYNKGKTGMMGEAGPEAILPLSRGPGGSLGVEATVTPVTVNIINQANADIEQNERTGPNGEKTIELLIRTKVREQLANGSYDRVMQQSYGLNRRGS